MSFSVSTNSVDVSQVGGKSEASADLRNRKKGKSSSGVNNNSYDEEDRVVRAALVSLKTVVDQPLLSREGLSTSASKNASELNRGAADDPNSNSTPEEQPLPELPDWLLPFFVFMLVLAGAGDDLIIKYMNLEIVPICDAALNPGVDCSAIPFSDPWYQALIMYIGQSFTLPLYELDKWWSKKRNLPQGHLELMHRGSSTKKKCPVFWWMIPAFLDISSSILIIYAMTMSHVSTVQLLRNFNIIMCAFLTLFYLKRQLRIFHWFGVLVIFIGLCFTALSSFSSDQQGDQTNIHTATGIVLTLLGTSLSSVQLIMEEKLMRSYTASPFSAVGWMGIFGVMFGFMGEFIAQVSGLQDFRETAYQMTHDTGLIWASVGFILSVAVFNATSLCITKLASSLLLAIVMSSRGVLVWAAELCLKWNSFDWFSFTGMVLLTVGFFLYNHMIPSWACCGPYDRWADREVRCCVVYDSDEDESSYTDDDDEDYIENNDGKDTNHMRDYGSQLTSDSMYTDQEGGEGRAVEPKQSEESEYSWVYVEKEEWVDD